MKKRKSEKVLDIIVDDKIIQNLRLFHHKLLGRISAFDTQIFSGNNYSINFFTLTLFNFFTFFVQEKATRNVP